MKQSKLDDYEEEFKKFTLDDLKNIKRRTAGGNYTSMAGAVPVGINLKPRKDRRTSDKLNVDIENDHTLYGAGSKRDPKTGRMTSRYGKKDVRTDSIQYDRARYKHNPRRNLYATARNTYQRCLLKGIPLDEEFYTTDCVSPRKLCKTKYRPSIKAGEKFKDVCWAFRDYLMSMWEVCKKTDYKCPCCDTQMIINAGNGRKHKHSRTLDRKDPLKGYIKGNMRFICDHCNRIMSSASPEEVFTVALFMLENDYDLIKDHSKLFLLRHKLDMLKAL